jgi:flagellar motor switch/type III secretory pathway protein FliN
VPAPFPWPSLPRLDRRTARLATALAAVARRGTHVGEGGHVVRKRGEKLVISRGPRRGTHVGTGVAELGIEGVRLGAIGVIGGRQLDGRLADPSAAVVRIRGRWGSGFVVVPGMVVRAIAQIVMGGPDELGAPRPLTVVERGVAVVAVAAVAVDAGIEVAVEGCELGGPQVPAEVGGEAAVVDVELVGVIPGAAAVVLPVAAVLAVPRLGIEELVEASPAGLAAEVRVPVVVARAAIGREDLGGLRVRDIVVAARVGARTLVLLPIVRGAATAALAPSGGRVTVLTPYQRDPMDETLADDASLDVAVAVGDLRLSVRALLELSPGQVLELGKPLGSQVELRVGSRVVARGELVDVDGGVGVRVLAIEPLSSGPPAC